jgi:hypothetical protein
MPTVADCLSPVAEARLSIESAKMAAEAMLASEVGNSMIVGEVNRHLSEAVMKLKRAEQPPAIPGRLTIFPSKEAAQDAIDRLPVSPNTIYRISQHGDGRCAIEIFRREGWV